ncbi:MAG: hypothetical protein WDN72_09890 [Alphaproteobacteria bacterium]
MKAYLEETRARGLTVSSDSLADLESQRAVQHRNQQRLGWTLALLLAALLAVQLVHKFQ